MSEVVTAEQIEAFRTNGFVVVDDLLTDAELDTFEPLVTAAVAYRSAGDERTLEEPRTGPVRRPEAWSRPGRRVPSTDPAAGPCGIGMPPQISGELSEG
jgi:hypothetical protein